LSAAKVIQLAWSALLLLTILPGLFIEPTAGRMLWTCFALVMLVAAIGCLGNRRSCWCIAFLGCLIAFVTHAPMLAQNVNMYLHDDPLYVDSPATIYVVALLSLSFLAPPALIFSCLLLDRRRFVQVWYRAPIHSTDTATLAKPSSADNPYEPPGT
tara:strand:+ start:489 stop:956 length:468 start_codon:yes stop_codon:yes gene_type:complete